MFSPSRTIQSGFWWGGQVLLAICLLLSAPVAQIWSNDAVLAERNSTTAPETGVEAAPGDLGPRTLLEPAELPPWPADAPAGDVPPAREDEAASEEDTSAIVGTTLDDGRSGKAIEQGGRPSTATAPGLRPRRAAVLPILMYHRVKDLPRGETDAYLKDLTVSPLQFRKQLDFLEANGVRTASLVDLMNHLRGGEPLPPRAVVLSFDDGYDDNYTQAYRLLRQYGMTATFFVVANLVGTPGYMTWEQLREMQRNGMAIECHSLDHVDLAHQPRAELVRQITESRRTIEERLQWPVRFIAYPSGRYSPQVIETLKQAGYEAAVTTEYGVRHAAGNLFALPRVRVKGADSVESLAAKMVPSDWLHGRGTFGR